MDRERQWYFWYDSISFFVHSELTELESTFHFRFMIIKFSDLNLTFPFKYSKWTLFPYSSSNSDLIATTVNQNFKNSKKFSFYWLERLSHWNNWLLILLRCTRLAPISPFSKQLYVEIFDEVTKKKEFHHIE